MQGLGFVMTILVVLLIEYYAFTAFKFAVRSMKFPFRQLRNDIYLTLDIMMYVERSQALEFMHGVNKETRIFLCQHYISIKNGFINEGLIY
jgi:hypothetical protein